MPPGPSSTAIDRVRPITPCFAAVYGLARAVAPSPSVDAMLTIRPSRLRARSAAHARISSACAVLAYARADLMSAFEPLPDAVLDWVPPAAAFEKFDPWAPAGRTIRGRLRHVLQFEVYYRDGPRDGAAKGISEQTGDPPAEHA